jgi:hypothetical protein
MDEGESLEGCCEFGVLPQHSGGGEGSAFPALFHPGGPRVQAMRPASARDMGRLFLLASAGIRAPSRHDASREDQPPRQIYLATAACRSYR